MYKQYKKVGFVFTPINRLVDFMTPGSNKPEFGQK